MKPPLVEPEQLVIAQSRIKVSDPPMALEAITLLVLLSMTFWSVGPLLEEWGLFRAFDRYGLAYIGMFAHEIPMRPLHLFAYAFQWALGNGHPVGVAAATAVLLTARYVLARWAVTPLLGGYNRWAVAVLAAVAASWPGAWLGRYGSAQLSVLFFFAALGFAIRLSRRWSITSTIGCALSIVLVLATYQGLALCLITLPFLTLLWRFTPDTGASHGSSARTRIARVGIGVATGFAIYGSYWLAVSSKLGGSGYEGLLLSDSGRLLTFAGLWSHVVAAFTTAYVQQPHLLPAWVLTACLLCWGAISRLGTAKQKLFILVIAFLLVAALPLLSLIYVNPAHIRDADRVLFPTSFGFVLVCISLLGRFRSDAVNSANTVQTCAVVAMIVFSSFFSALNSRKYVQIQEYVTTQTLVAVKDHHSKSVLVRDSTGILGDVYTLYETAFGDALAVLGSDIAATICTPLNVDRLHLVAQRFPLQSTRRCEELPVVPGELVLTARWQDGVLLLAPATQ